jgi:NAD(P)H-dependent FMN reductase
LDGSAARPGGSEQETLTPPSLNHPGTARPGNYTAKALALVLAELVHQDGVEVDLIDPATLELPFPGTDHGAVGPKGLRKIVTAATGVVLATPGYLAGYSSVIKLVA